MTAVIKLTILSAGLPSKWNQNSKFILIKYRIFYFELKEVPLSFAAPVKSLL